MIRQFIRSALILLPLIIFTACQSDPPQSALAPQTPIDYMTQDSIIVTGSRAPVMAKGGNSGLDASPPSAPQQESGNPSDMSFLAYRYTYSYQLPAASVVKTAHAHAKLCQKAGIRKCQLLSSTSSQQSDTHSYARLSLRVAPNWLDEFTRALTQSVSAENGALKDSSVSAEDLTRSILDTDARLNALRTLRVRLQNLLETKTADLKDLLALEREISRVQGQLESTTSQLKALKKRVSMSVVDINYQSKPVAVSRETVSPISRALKAFIGNISQGIARVINVIAYILPWLILIIPAFWLIRRIWRRRKSA